MPIATPAKNIVKMPTMAKNLMIPVKGPGPVGCTSWVFMAVLSSWRLWVGDVTVFGLNELTLDGLRELAIRK